MEPRLVLMSLKPEPYRDIREGRKYYEFRTRYFRGPTIAFIYVSAPVRAVKAVIRFGSPILGTAEELARSTGRGQTGPLEKLEAYLHGKKGYALPVEQVTVLEPISLEELRQKIPGVSIPQSYYFLDSKPELLEVLRNAREQREGRK